MKPVVKAKFHIGNFGSISSVTASDYAQTSAFQGGDYVDSSISVEKPTGINAFVLDISGLDSGATYKDSYNGLLSSENYFSGNTYNESTYNGYKLSNDYRITVRGSRIKSITINFDKYAGVYASCIQPYGELYIKNNNYSFTWFANNNASYTSMVFDIIALNKPNVPVMITSIVVRNDVTITSQDTLHKLNRGSQSTDNFSSISYGIATQYGNISFIDTPDKYFGKLAELDLLHNIKLELFVQDNLIGTYIADDDWNYNVYNNEINVGLESLSLLKLQDMVIKDEIISNGEQIDKPSESTMVYQENISAYKVFNDIIIKNTKKYLSFDISDVENYLMTIKINFPYFTTGSLWEQLNKLCELCLLRVYELADGTIKVSRG